MDKESVLKIVSDLKKVLTNKGIHIDKLVLYGSYAALTYKEGSDIDLVVISDSFESMDYWERLDVVSDAVYELSQPIEAVCLTTEEWDNKASIVVGYAQKEELV